MTADEIQARIEDTVPPATEEQIRTFEAEIGHTLPEDYRAFLARCRGGSTDWKCEYEGVSPDGEKRSLLIGTINGVRKGYTYSLSYNRKFIGNRIPKSLIGIMDDPGGNLICLGVSGPERGRVYFWDHECAPNPREWDGRLETAENIDLIAGSFAEFLSGIRMTESAEPRAAPGAQARPMAEARGRLRLEHSRGVTVVHFVDHKFIDDQACEELNDQLESLEADPGKKQFLLNFENVQYLGAVALTMLCDFTMSVQSAQGTIKVCCVPPDIDTLFRLTGVDRLFKIYPDQQSALSSF
jgi:anti-anti-sigma factor